MPPLHYVLRTSREALGAGGGGPTTTSTATSSSRTRNRRILLSRSAIGFVVSLLLFVLVTTYLQLAYHLLEQLHHHDGDADDDGSAASTTNDLPFLLSVPAPSSSRDTNRRNKVKFVLPPTRAAANETDPSTGTSSSRSGRKEEQRIPHRLIFTFKTNLLETKAPPRFYRNVQNTIRLYREAFGADGGADDDDDFEGVWFLDNIACRAVLSDVEPELVPHFDKESRGAFKADLCRIAALLKKGGYYLDIDMKTVEPFVAPTTSSENTTRTTTFASVWMPNRRGLFQSFVASTPGHPILRRALDLMLRYYHEKETLRQSIARQDLSDGRKVFDIPADAVPSPASSTSGQQQQQQQQQQNNAITNAKDSDKSQPHVHSLSELGGAWYGTLGESVRSALSADEQSKMLQALANQVHLRQRIPSGLIGPSTLLDAYYDVIRQHPDVEDRCAFLEELNLEDGDTISNNNTSASTSTSSSTAHNGTSNDHYYYPELPRQEGMGGACNYVVHDPRGRRVYFYSRFAGASERCLDKDAVKAVKGRIQYEHSDHDKQQQQQQQQQQQRRVFSIPRKEGSSY